MLTGFEVWRYYLGIKLHFTSKDYDAVKSSGHVTAGRTAYAKRRDRLIFESLAEKFDQPREVIKYLVANFAYGHNNVIYDRESAQELLQKWIKNKESLSRVFANDLQVIREYFEKNHIRLSALDSTCIVLKLMKSKLINVETVTLLNQYIPSLADKWSALPECKMLYESELLRIRKLAAFLCTTETCNKVWIDFKDEYEI